MQGLHNDDEILKLNKNSLGSSVAGGASGGGEGAWLWGGLKSTASASPRPLARGSGATVRGNAASKQHKPDARGRAPAPARKKGENNSKRGTKVYTCAFNGEFG